MRRLSRKFKRPRARFNAQRITEEKAVLDEYGLRRKREIWKADARLRSLRQRARDLIATRDAEGEKVLLAKMEKLGLLKKGTTLDDVLALTRKDILERRLQTVIFKRSLAKTVKEARQMIVHGHIYIGTQRVSYPSYHVTSVDEGAIEFRSTGKGGKDGGEKAKESKGSQEQGGKAGEGEGASEGGEAQGKASEATAAA